MRRERWLVWPGGITAGGEDDEERDAEDIRVMEKFPFEV